MGTTEIILLMVPTGKISVFIAMTTSTAEGFSEIILKGKVVDRINY
jgi:hypothetical protein